MGKIRRKLISIGKSSLGVIVPRPLCEMLGLERESYVDISLVGEQIIIKRAKEK